MFSFFKNLFEPKCKHQWTILEKIRVFDVVTQAWSISYSPGAENSLPNEYKYVLQCKHCGNLKTIKIS